MYFIPTIHEHIESVDFWRKNAAEDKRGSIEVMYTSCH